MAAHASVRVGLRMEIDLSDKRCDLTPCHRLPHTGCHHTNDIDRVGLDTYTRNGHFVVLYVSFILKKILLSNIKSVSMM